MAYEARTVTSGNASEVAEWCEGVLVTEINALDHSATQPGINVLCGDQVKRASLGSIIMKLHDGTFDVLK